jgi:hypothetical protein
VLTRKDVEVLRDFLDEVLEREPVEMVGVVELKGKFDVQDSKFKV